MPQLLTAEQIDELKRIIAKHHAIFILKVLGPDALTGDELRLLEDLGSMAPEVKAMEHAYLYGQILAKQGEKALEMDYEDFKKEQARSPMPLSQPERFAIQNADQHAGAHIRHLGARVVQTASAVIFREDASARAKLLQEEVIPATKANLEKREGIQKLKSELGKRVGDWSRDWNRVAVTEKVAAMNAGMADNFAKNYGDPWVYKLPMPDACKHCKRLHIGPDGHPRIFRLSTLQANGTNVGLKAAEWNAVVGPTHPHCQCQLVRVPEGWGFDEDGILVPEGEFGIKYGSEGDIIKAAFLEDQLQKAFAVKERVNVGGMPISIEQRIGDLRHWKDASGYEGTTRMIFAYGYIDGTLGPDGDEYDCYVGPDPLAPFVYIVHQIDPETGEYDEDKAMVGFPNAADAKTAYLAHYDSPKYFGTMSQVPVEEFRQKVMQTRTPGSMQRDGMVKASPAESKRDVTKPLLRILDNEKSKLSKQESGYLDLKDALYACNECKHWIPGGPEGKASAPSRCVKHGKNDTINANGRCGSWERGEPVPGRVPQGKLTKAQSRYWENEYGTGFRCNRCQYYVKGQTCEVVEGNIKPHATCLEWRVAHDVPIPIEEIQKAARRGFEWTYNVLIKGPGRTGLRPEDAAQHSIMGNRAVSENAGAVNFVMGTGSLMGHLQAASTPRQQITPAELTREKERKKQAKDGRGVHIAGDGLHRRGKLTVEAIIEMANRPHLVYDFDEGEIGTRSQLGEIALKDIPQNRRHLEDRVKERINNVSPNYSTPENKRPKFIIKGGLFIGPRGGKWADPQHKIPWKEKKVMKRPQQRPSEPKKKREWKEGYPPDIKTPNFDSWKTGERGGTEEKHWDSEAENFKPERLALHKEIKAKMSGRAKSVPEGQQPTAIITMGGPAAGKSTILDHYVGAAEEGMVRIDADKIKEEVPEYKEMIAESWRMAAAAVHHESTTVMRGLKQEAISDRKPLIIDTTGADLDIMLDDITKLKKAGYRIRVMMPHLDVEEGLKRVHDRAEREGRFVPDRVVKSIYEKVPDNVASIAAVSDDFALLDNRGEGEPKLVYMKKGAQHEVHDEETTKLFPGLFEGTTAQPGSAVQKSGQQESTQEKLMKTPLKKALEPDEEMKKLLAHMKNSKPTGEKKFNVKEGDYHLDLPLVDGLDGQILKGSKP